MKKLIVNLDKALGVTVAIEYKVMQISDSKSKAKQLTCEALKAVFFWVDRMYMEVC